MSGCGKVRAMQAEPTSEREAALVVHSLPDADRQKLLGALNEEERQRLDTLLAELTALGIPRTFDVRGLLTRLAHEARVQPSADNDRASLIRFLQAQSPATITSILRTQSAATCSLIVHAHPWRWKSAVLASLSAQTPTKIINRVAPGKVSQRAQDALLAELCLRCNDVADAPGDVRKSAQLSLPALWQKMRNRIVTRGRAWTQ